MEARICRQGIRKRELCQAGDESGTKLHENVSETLAEAQLYLNRMRIPQGHKKAGAPGQ